jgi:hypothetical protein
VEDVHLAGGDDADGFYEELGLPALAAELERMHVLADACDRAPEPVDAR